MSSKIMTQVSLRQSRRNLLKLILGNVGLSALTLLSITQPAKAGYSSWVNGYGYGSVTVYVLCAYRGEAYEGVKNTGFWVGAAIPPIPGYLGRNRPSECHIETFVSAKLQPLWGVTDQLRVAGGDSAGSQSSLDQLVTPVSPKATAKFSVVGKRISSTQAEFTVDWGNTNGIGHRLRWYEYSGSIPNNFQGEATQLPNFVQLATLLHEETQINLVQKPEVFQITAKNADHIILTIEATAKSQ